MRTLIGAVRVANQLPTGDVTTINLTAGCKYRFYRPQSTRRDVGNSALSVKGSIVINGNGATIRRVAGTPQFRLFLVKAGATLTLIDVTLANGQARSGKAGAPADQRTLVNASIWRYHPITHKFEVVANGTTNPWGHDWDKNGQLFFINTVIGHLWHVIPGAFYKKMYGEHPNPYLYELIDQTADHFHWDTREVWSDVRKIGVTSTSSERGGGTNLRLSERTGPIGSLFKACSTMRSDWRSSSMRTK